MIAKQLKQAHANIWIEDSESPQSIEKHTKLSIQFAISVLEKLHEKNKYKEGSQALYYKIQELKQYLDE